jgi:hypothetical protein
MASVIGIFGAIVPALRRKQTPNVAPDRDRGGADERAAALAGAHAAHAAFKR